MIGAIIGDIVGSRFEFNNHRSTRFRLFSEASQFTDDTVCTVAVAEWLLSGGDAVGSLAPILQGWCKKYPFESYGAQFSQWIYNPVPYDSFGNGAAMRVSPVAMYARSSREVELLACASAKVSHDHPEGIKGAVSVATAGWLAWRGATKAQIRAFVSRMGYDLSFTCDSIRASNWFDETCQVTVPQAVVCFLESTDFESAIRLAVSIGGDSDTIAAIAGGLAEAFYKEIPVSMVAEARCRLPYEMLAVVDKFYKSKNHESIRNSEVIPF